MNTRNLLGAVIVVLGVMGASAGGFAPRTAHAATAGSLPASQVLGSETATLMQQTLNAIQGFLNVVRARVNDTAHPMTDGEKAAMSNVLESLRGSLVQINSTIVALDAQAVAVANQNGTGQVLGQHNAAPSAPVASAPQPQGSGSEITANNGQAADGQGATNVTVGSSNGNEEVAVVSNSLGSKKGLLWAILALVVILAGGGLFSRYRKGGGMWPRDKQIAKREGVPSGELMPREQPARPMVQPVAVQHPVQQPAAPQQPVMQSAPAMSSSKPAKTESAVASEEY